MKKSKAYSVIFIVIITVFWGFVLSFAATSLRDAQEFNAMINMRTNILVAVGLLERSTELEREQINDLYNQRVESFLIDAEGRVIEGASAEGVDLEIQLQDADSASWQLPVFVVTDDGQVSAYAFPVFGKGLWSTLYGYLALENDLDTVKGMTFYDHNETAGLGAEIEQAWFQENFVGKQIFDGDQLRSITVVKGEVEKVVGNAADREYFVDGISGASMTGRGVTNLLEDKLRIYEPYIRRVRAERTSAS